MLDKVIVDGLPGERYEFRKRVHTPPGRTFRHLLSATDPNNLR